MSEPRRNMTISIPVTLHEQIKAQAKRYGLSMNSVILLRLQFKSPAAPP